MAVPPLKTVLFHFILCFWLQYLESIPKKGVDLSVNILGLYHLKLEEGTTPKKCVEVDLFYSEASCF